MIHKEALRKFVVTYTSHLSVGAFLVGFVLDNLSLPRIDNPIAHLIIFSYLLLAGTAIILSGFSSRGHHPPRFLVSITPFLPPFIQFIFGGLFSALFVYYFRSASLLGSWAFLLMLLAMIVGNELFRSRYDRLPFQLSIFFTTLFGFLIFYLPLFFNRLDGFMFFLSGTISLCVAVLFMSAMFVVSPALMHDVWKRTAIAVAAIFLCLNFLYATRSIPPVPLVLISADIYHGITKNADGAYVGQDEDRTWYERHVALTPKYHFSAGEPVFFYSAVFAPAEFAVPIYHEWQYRDDTNDEWVTNMRVPFSIYGGRGGGYRGYSIKTTVTSGRWRVLVKTARGQLLGQHAFTVVPVNAAPVLHEKEL